MQVPTQVIYFGGAKKMYVVCSQLYNVVQIGLLHCHKNWVMGKWQIDCYVLVVHCNLAVRKTHPSRYVVIFFAPPLLMSTYRFYSMHFHSQSWSGKTWTCLHMKRSVQVFGTLKLAMRTIPKPSQSSLCIACIEPVLRLHGAHTIDYKMLQDC